MTRDEAMTRAEHRRLRARGLLRARLFSARRSATAGWTHPDEPVVQAGHDGAIRALEHAGALTPTEGAMWRERLAGVRPAVPDTPDTPADVVTRAFAHLDALAQWLEPGDDQAWQACHESLIAYERTGILTTAEREAWRDQLLRRIGVDPPTKPCSFMDLRRAIIGPAMRVDGARITLVECYADGVVVQWHHATDRAEVVGPPRLWPQHERELDEETGDGMGLVAEDLEDDRGTVYEGHSRILLGIDGAGMAVRLGSTTFTPAVPDTATRLTWHQWTGAIEVPLP